MKDDRFLTGILIGVIVLVIIAVGLFFLRETETAYLEETTPDAVVLNYVLALQTADFTKAYTFLPEEYQGQEKPSIADFRSVFAHEPLSQTGIKILSTDIEDDQAWVQVESIQSSGNLFSGVYRSESTAILTLDKTGDWKLISMPYPFWGWDWFDGLKIIR